MKKTLQLLLLTPALFFVLESCQKHEEATDNTTLTDDAQLRTMMNEGGSNPDEMDVKSMEAQTDDVERRKLDFVYTESNAAGTNEILIFRQLGNGTLNAAGTVASGGNGTGMGLGSQGAVITSHNKEWLLAVNAGNNSISVFHIGHGGMLTLVSTTNSKGVMPVSLTVHYNKVYVVNSTSANIAGFEMDQNGVLTHIPNSIRALSSTTAMPAQISFSPNGDYLYVTEKMTNKIGEYEVDNGVAQPGTFINSTGVTPFGYDFARNHMIVSNATGGAPNASTVTSYGGVLAGNLAPVSGPVATNQSAACWVATTHYGRFAFVTNTGSDNISSFYVGHNGDLHLIAGNAAATGDMPIDLVVANNNYHVYALCSADNQIFEFNRNLWGTLTQIGSVSGVPASATGLAVR